jgi:hypothetical protein
MNFEAKLKDQFVGPDSEIDADAFIKNLHKTRIKKAAQFQRIKTGIVSSVFLIIVGLFTIFQLDENAPGIHEYQQELFQLGITEEYEEEFNNYLAYYLVDESEDIWTTLSFLYDSDYQPIISLVENKL